MGFYNHDLLIPVQSPIILTRIENLKKNYLSSLIESLTPMSIFKQIFIQVFIITLKFEKLCNYNVESFYIPVFKRPHWVNVKIGLEEKGNNVQQDSH